MSSGGGTNGDAKVIVERRDHVMIITLNRPEARNAVDREVCVLVGAAVEDGEHDPEVLVIVITGAGDLAFCAGADLKSLARGEQITPDEQRDWSFAGFANHFTSKPTIAAVNGSALGGGTELALACDLVVAVETATFGLPEVTRGLIAGAGGTFRIATQLPRKIAMRAVLTGQPFTAAEAARWGLVNEVVPTGQALEVALGLASQIAENAPLAVQASKRLAYGSFGSEGPDESRLWELNGRELASITRSEDAAEGTRAFAEKRPPVWRGR